MKESEVSYPAASSLDHYLGDPCLTSNDISFASIMERDEADCFPETMISRLMEWGFGAYNVPEQWGGSLKNLDELLALVRVVVRRDLSVMPGIQLSFPGMITIAQAGTEAQKQELAQMLPSGACISFALSEEKHGCNLLNGEMVATASGSDYILDGSKWYVGMGSRSDALVVMARTGDRGPTAFSLFLLDKRNPDVRAALSCSAPLKTVGMRGMEFCNIELKNCRVPQSALIGHKGSGFELVAKTQQPNKVMSLAAGLGCLDSALRTTLDFTRNRLLKNTAIVQIPHVRLRLVTSFANLLLCDAITTAAARSLHVLPEQASVWSSAAKYSVPAVCSRAMDSLSWAMGARSYMREGHMYGLFSKLVRDAGILRVIDTNAISNLQVITSQLLSLARYHRGPAEPAVWSHLSEIFDTTRELPPFKPYELSLINRGHDDVLNGLATCIESLQLLEPNQVPLKPLLLQLGEELVNQVDWLFSEVERLKQSLGPTYSASPKLLELARRYSDLHGCAAAFHFWTHDRQNIAPQLANGAWLAICLDETLANLNGYRCPLDAEVYEDVATTLFQFDDQNLMFSLLPFTLAPKGAAQQFGRS